MIITIILMFTLLLFFGKILLKNELSKKMLYIYIIWWGILLSISSYNPYGLFPVSDRIYFYLTLSVLSFMAGFVLNNLNTKVSTTANSSYDIIENIQVDFEKLSKNKIFLSLLILFTIIILMYLIKYNKIIALHGVEDARNMRFYVGEVFSSSYEIFFYNFFVESFSIIVSLYVAFSLVWMKFNKVFYIAILYAYLYSSMGAGRFYLIELIFFIVFLNLIKSSFLIHKTNDKDFIKLKKSKKKVLLIIVPFIIFLYGFSIYLSNFRKGIFELNFQTLSDGNDDFFKHIIIYCVGSFRALEYGINNYTEIIGVTFGRVTFGGIDEIFGVVLASLGFQYEYVNLAYGDNVVKNINIGYNQDYNGLFTNVFGMYLDLQVLGIVLISLFWGVVYSKVLSFFIKKPNFYSLLILVFLSVVFMLSPLKWKMQSPSSWIFIGSMFFLLRNRKLNFK